MKGPFCIVSDEWADRIDGPLSIDFIDYTVRA